MAYRSCAGVAGALVLGVALSNGSCGGSSRGTGANGGGSQDASAPDGATPTCTTDTDCASKLPPTMPADCAIGACNAVQGVCVFAAKDQDGDGHLAADCKSTSGFAIQDGDDCDDQDPNLYPGHPEPCTPTPDGGVDAGYCAQGQVSCRSDGTRSACSGMCTACDPGVLGCQGLQPAQCNASGTWTPMGSACQNQACINGACQGTCTPGTTECSVTTTRTCDAAGNWKSSSCPSGEACNTSACAPGCNIGGTYYAASAPDPSESCRSCQPAKSTTAWTDLVGTSCGAAGNECCSGACSDPQTDVNNCGGCGRACSGATSPACAGARCSYTLATGQGNPSAITVDATSVYWTTDGTVMKAPLAGGVPTQLALGSTPDAIVVDAASVYWADRGTSGNLYADGAIVMVPLGGGTPTTLASGQDAPSGIAVDTTSVYWVNADAGTIMKLPLGGGTPTTLASGQNGPQGIAVDATSVYWTNLGGGTVMKVLLGGGVPTTLASGRSFPWGIAVDAANVYWTDNAMAGSAGTVVEVPLGGGIPTTLASGRDSPQAIVVDATGVYWTDNETVSLQSGGVLTVPLAGGTPVTFTSGAHRFSGIAVDATSVYWTEAFIGSPGTVMRAAK